MQKNQYMWNKIIDWLAASVMSIIGYLSPIKDIAHMLVIFFLLDVLWGWLADRKLNNAPFKPSKVWNKTIPRMALAIVLLIACYMLDDRTDQHWISIYKVVGWFIASLLIISITRNGIIVTNWKPLGVIENIFKNRIEKQTGVKIDLSDDETN